MYNKGTMNGKRCACCFLGVYCLVQTKTEKHANGQTRYIEFYKCTQCSDMLEFIAHIEY